MHQRNTFIPAIALLSSAMLLNGCANHLPQRSEHEERIERNLIDHSLQIDLGELEVLELPQRRVRVHEQKTFEVTTINVTRRYDRYTPYQAWRELYEIPLGALAVVGGIGANVLDVVTFGSVPDSATKDWINYGIAGLNPAMNVESNGRSQQNLASLEEQRQEPTTEYSSLPWAERPVMVKAAGKSHELLTDRNGILRLNLLDSPFAELNAARIDSLQISVTDDLGSAHAEATLPVSRTLRGKLREAHDLIYNDLEGDDVAQWVHRVKRLSELGLEEEANELEQSLIELTRNDPELQKIFLLALSRTTGKPVIATEGF
jgi:hypothetical protein